MKKKEEKILDKLREEVFKKDLEIKNRYDELKLNSATKEALIQMTDLSLNEITEIEKKVRIKYFQRRRNVIALSTVILIIFIMILGFSYYSSNNHETIDQNKRNKSSKFKNELVFSEDFTSNKNNWPTYNDFKYKRYFQDGKYFFTSNKKDSCFEDLINLKIPKSYTAEVTLAWEEGRYEPYGIKFTSTFDKRSRFIAIFPENKIGYIKDDTEQHDKRWNVFKNKPENVHENAIKFSIKPRPWTGDPRVRTLDVNYYVNGEYIDYLVFDDYGTFGIKNDRKLESYLSISVCGCQTVSFDKLRITDNVSGRVVYNGSFEELKDRLHPGKEIVKHSYIQNGAYTFETNNNSCNKSVLSKDLKDNTKISLTSRWSEGENNSYGLILEQDNNNYYAFNLKPDGRACFTLHMNGGNIIYIDNLETGLKNITDTSIVQTALFKGEMLEYYVNDQLILKERHQLKPLNSMGFRVCGSQTIAFEKLEVWE